MNFFTNYSCKLKKSKINIVSAEKNSISPNESSSNLLGYKTFKSYQKLKDKQKISNASDDVEINKIIKESLEEISQINNLLKNDNHKNSDNAITTLQDMVFANEDVVRKTLPGFIITLIIRNSDYISEDYIITSISPIMGDLRKPDGSRYKVNIFI